MVMVLKKAFDFYILLNGNNALKKLLTHYALLCACIATKQQNRRLSVNTSQYL